MKKLLLLLLCAAMLLPLTSCAGERYDLLYSLEYDGTAYCVRGTEPRAKQLVVKKDGKVLWSKKVSVDKAVGSLGGTYGFAADDLNFDGYRDLQLATAVAGDCVSYVCFLYDAESESYVLSEELSKLYNVKANAELKAVFGFTHSYTTEEAYADVPASYTTVDSATKYIWKDGVLTPEIRASWIYYSETARYHYSIAYYDETTKQFVEDYNQERWFNKDNYEKQDLSFIYYFK